MSGGRATLTGKFLTQDRTLREQCRLLLCQLGDALIAVFQRLKFGSGFLCISQHLFDRAAVLAGQLPQQRQPLLHPRQAARVEFDAAQVVAQRARQILHLIAHFLKRLRLGCEAHVDARERRHIALRLADQIEDGGRLPTPFLEHCYEVGGQRRQLFGVREAHQFGFQRLLFARREHRRADLVYLKAQQIDALHPVALALAQRVQLATYGINVLHHLTDLRPQRLQSGKAIQQVQMLAHAQQAQVLALPVDIDELLGDVTQQGRGDDAPVDPRHRPPVATQFAAQPQCIRRVALQRLVLQQRCKVALLRGRQHKQALHTSEVGAGAHRRRIAAPAK